jgi:hypothetical protein
MADTVLKCPATGWMTICGRSCSDYACKVLAAKLTQVPVEELEKKSLARVIDGVIVTGPES